MVKGVDCLGLIGVQVSERNACGISGTYKTAGNWEVDLLFTPTSRRTTRAVKLRRVRSSAALEGGEVVPNQSKATATAGTSVGCGAGSKYGSPKQHSAGLVCAATWW